MYCVLRSTILRVPVLSVRRLVQPGDDMYCVYLCIVAIYILHNPKKILRK